MARQLVKSGRRVAVLTSATDGEAGYAIADGIHLFRIPVARAFRQRYPIPLVHHKRAHELQDQMKALDVGFFVVNARFYFHSLYALHLAKKWGLRAIVVEHGSQHLTVQNALADAAGRIYEHLFTRMLRWRYRPLFYGVSMASAQWLKHFGISPSGVLPNSVCCDDAKVIPRDLRTEFGLPPSAVCYCYAGRFIGQKGILPMLEAFAMLVQEHAEAHLFLAGDGPLRQRVEASCDNNIHWLGALDHPSMMALLASIDVVVLPSIHPEGLPTVLLEAGLHHCAVVATGQGGTRELLAGGGHGIHLPLPDPEALKEAFQTLLRDPGLRRNMADALHRHVLQGYTWESTVRMLDGIESGTETLCIE
ncbi:MAG: glycosyltransferase family 4 protein [Saprospiraceae bacterium]|jgi:glycosyltransferase involved in cell wall biosynthesis|nr:glycosyltransferase family 4 protein [Saprospiraceae bacterium]MBP9209530.1 glycosyltransferase family 4 protein [Saprospiraceae bacterium]